MFDNILPSFIWKQTCRKAICPASSIFPNSIAVLRVLVMISPALTPFGTESTTNTLKPKAAQSDTESISKQNHCMRFTNACVVR